MITNTELETSLIFFTASIFGEYRIFKQGTSPYFFVNISACYFYKTTAKADSIDLTDGRYLDWWWRMYYYEKDFRYGAGGGVGYQFLLSSKFLLDFQAEFNALNLLSQQNKKGAFGTFIEEKTMKTIGLTLGILYRFN